MKTSTFFIVLIAGGLGIYLVYMNAKKRASTIKIPKLVTPTSTKTSPLTQLENSVGTALGEVDSLTAGLGTGLSSWLSPSGPSATTPNTGVISPSSQAGQPASQQILDSEDPQPATLTQGPGQSGGVSTVDAVNPTTVDSPIGDTLVGPAPTPISLTDDQIVNNSDSELYDSNLNYDYDPDASYEEVS